MCSTCQKVSTASVDAVDAGWPGTAVFAAVFTEKSVALARAGDRRWEVLRMGHLPEVFDVTYHRGKFYILGNMKVAVDGHYAGNRFVACVGVVDFVAGDPLSTAKVSVLPLHFEYAPRLDFDFRLIGSPSGDLLLTPMIRGISRVSVFQVDLHTAGNRGGSERQKVVEVTGLGSDRALLMGDPCSTAVSTRGAPQLKGNCIYWISGGGCPFMEVFSFDIVREETRQLPQRSVLAWFVPGLL